MNIVLLPISEIPIYPACGPSKEVDSIIQYYAKVSRWVLNIRLAYDLKPQTRKYKEHLLVDLVSCESLSHLSKLSQWG